MSFLGRLPVFIEKNRLGCISCNATRGLRHCRVSRAWGPVEARTSCRGVSIVFEHVSIREAQQRSPVWRNTTTPLARVKSKLL
ncbi:hypothetical protein AcW1_005279 [Taiwanofungus camphoratus]|nr:hypothetical protein AcV5_005598 [Antrodia cinnamomea]KAI0956651.1 hypothetical protein AcW1_005279 [Antrodia cinnamomea]